MIKQIDVEPDCTAPETPKSGGRALVIILLTLLLLIALGAAGFLGWRWSEEQKATLALQTEQKNLTAKIGDLERETAGLVAQINEGKAELERERADRLKEREQLLAEKRAELQRAYTQFNEIVYDSRKTLEYIGTVEDKLKAGKALSEQEAEDLRTVVNGLDLLHQRYGRPIQEFRELERFLSEQLAAPQMVAPRERYGLLKRIFSEDYKREREDFFKEQGQREAFDRAREKVKQAYASAQAQIQSLEIDSDKVIHQLEALAKSNDASATGIQDFFDKSKEILKIHDKIMNLEPEKELQGVRP